MMGSSNTGMYKDCVVSIWSKLSALSMKKSFSKYVLNSCGDGVSFSSLSFIKSPFQFIACQIIFGSFESVRRFHLSTS